MKGSRWFILAMVLFLAVMFLVEYNLPKKFVWNPTFSRYDYQPFGCAIFDDVLTDSWPGDYYLNDWTFYNFENDTTDEPLAILAVAQRFQFTKTDRNAIMRLAERGNKVILAATGFSLSDTLGYDMSYAWFRASELKKYVGAVNRRDSLYWLADSASAYPAAIFEVYPQLCDAFFTKYDSLSVPLVRRDRAAASRKDSITLAADSLIRSQLKDTLPESQDSVRLPVELPTGVLALRHLVGKGEIVLISTPLLFTNYGVLDKNNAAYIFRLLSSAKDLPLYRTEAYNKSEYEQRSPFRYFLSQPPLRWGLYLTMIALVLFMVFTARRRQRPIPVIRQPENKTLEFTELIGTLYFQKKNHADLVRKKFTYFAEALRRNIQVDVEEEVDEGTLYRKIASKTGMEEEKIARLFAGLRPVIKGERNVSEQEMKDYIDGMNEILSRM